MEILKQQGAWGQPGLPCEFQDSQGYSDYILNKNKQTKPPLNQINKTATTGEMLG